MKRCSTLGKSLPLGFRVWRKPDAFQAYISTGVEERYFHCHSLAKNSKSHLNPIIEIRTLMIKKKKWNRHTVLKKKSSKANQHTIGWMANHILEHKTLNINHKGDTFKAHLCGFVFASLLKESRVRSSKWATPTKGIPQLWHHHRDGRLASLASACGGHAEKALYRRSQRPNRNLTWGWRWFDQGVKEKKSSVWKSSYVTYLQALWANADKGMHNLIWINFTFWTILMTYLLLPNSVCVCLCVSPCLCV